VLRLARTITDHAARLGITDGDTVSGVAVDELAEFIEHGLDFAADIVAGQKTGHFLDQRDNREALRTLIHRASGGQHVLDVFASTGGFSVYAAAGGAASVTSVDISEPTLAAAAENMQRNVHLDAVRQCRHDLVAGDAFEVMQRMVRNGRRFDVVVVDPPSFAQRQDSVDGALRAYARLTESACRLLVPDGVLVQASCSSRVPADRFYAGVRSAAQLAGFDLVERSRRGHAIDHPVVTREGEYLKCLVANVARLA
jgi:23S rRNA (cytosine1962-C5)-methyltransferase